MKKKIITTVILIMFCTLAFCQCVKAETEVKTTIQIKKDATKWDLISISDAYDKCQELNENNSALGTKGKNVMAHLSTNADWYAVSLLAYSAYGNKSNHNNTTGNNSGVMNLSSNLSYVSAILEDYSTTSNIYVQSLIDNKESKFVEKIKTNREENKPGLGLLSSEVLAGGFKWIEGNSYPIGYRTGLFGGSIGNYDGWSGRCEGKPISGITFRPVIWVK